jgi:putative peptidoglycan lipid II flippase
VVALALNELIGSSFHARQDTVTPMRAGFARVLCNLALCAALTPGLGHRGIALATTVSLYLKLAMLGRAVRGLYTGEEWRRHLRELLRVGAAVATMVVLVYPVAAFGSTPAVLESYAWPALGGLALLCLSVYCAALWVFARRQLLVHVAVVRRALRTRVSRTDRVAPAVAAVVVERKEVRV